jgi:hypothetical protein
VERGAVGNFSLPFPVRRRNPQNKAGLSLLLLSQKLKFWESLSFFKIFVDRDIILWNNREKL